MIDIISDKDLRDLIELNGLDSNAQDFDVWTTEDQHFILSDVFDSLCSEDKRALFEESLVKHFDGDKVDAGYWALVNSSSALPAYMRSILESQIDRAMRLIKQIRDEDNRS